MNSTDKPNPPKAFERFFAWFCHQAHLEGLEGDLYELFEQRVEEKGLRKARWLYIRDVLTLIRPSVSKNFFSYESGNTMGQLAHYTKAAWRTAKRRKTFAFIMLFGLTVAFTSAIFIGLFIEDELKYDNHIAEHSQKYRLYTVRYGGNAPSNHLPIVPPAMAPALREKFPQVAQAGRMIFDYSGSHFQVDGKIISEEKGFYIEPEVFDILDIAWLAGSDANMDKAKQLGLSESFYKRIFGDEPFNNQTLTVNNQEVTVVGIYRNFPAQSHLHPPYIFSFQTAANNWTEERMNSWVWQQFFTYVELEAGTDAAAFEEQFQEYIAETAHPQTKKYDFYYVPHLQPITDIHLQSSHFEWEIADRGNVQAVLFLAVAGVVLVFIAIINFSNLTIVQAIRRLKEVSIRKIVGAHKRQIIAQYIVEAILYVFLSGIFSLLLFYLLTPYFNLFTGKEFTFGLLLEPFRIGTVAAILLLLGCLTAIYPAIFASRYKAIEAIKGIPKVNKRSKVRDPRFLLVGVQFVLSIGLILASMVISQQFTFLQKKDLGFQPERLMLVELPRSMRQGHEKIRADFTSHHNIKDVSFCYGVPADIVAGDGVIMPNKRDKEFTSQMMMVDEHYIPTFGMEMVAGRAFDERPSDVLEAFILNETAVQNFGYEDAASVIGEPVEWTIWGSQDSLKTGKVIGVVKDFNLKSLHTEIAPVVMQVAPNYYSRLVLKLGGGDLHATLTFLEGQWRKFEDTLPFEFEFVDENFAALYENEQKLNTLFLIFTSLAIITAIIGVFGLVTFHVNSRSKEISIRKILGAKPSTLFGLLVRNYFYLLTICLIIAIPVSVYFLLEWLNNFAYHISLDGWLIAKVVLLTFVLTLATVGTQALWLARAKPIRFLKDE